MAATKEMAKFLAGLCTWEALIHTALILTKSTPKIAGYTLTRQLNLIQAIAAGAAAVLLALYGWSRPRMVRSRKAKAMRDLESVV